MRSHSSWVVDPRGTTLIETVVALGLLVILLGTMAVLLGVGRQVMVATRRDALAMTLARSRLEELEGLAFSTFALASGGTVEVTDLVTDLSPERAAVGGAGLAPSPADSLVAARSGYADYLDADGRWVGAGTAAAPEAFYTRRWSIRRTGAGPAELVLFEVLVAPLSVTARAPDATLLRQPGVVRLVGARSRRAL